MEGQKVAILISSQVHSTTLPPFQTIYFQAIATTGKDSFFPVAPRHLPRKFRFVQPERGKQPGPRKREEHISTTGKWRSFPKVPQLQPYVSSGIYFGKVKISGRAFKQSLEMKLWTTEGFKLPDFLTSHRINRSKVVRPAFPAVAGALQNGN